jgi:predicted Zn-dependent peptidase
MNLAEAERAVRGWFGSWRPSGRPAMPTPPLSPPSATAGRVLGVPRAGTSQVQAMLGCTLAASDERRRLTHNLLAAYLTRQLEARLRGSMGATYGIGSGVEEFGAGFSLLVLSGSIDNVRLRPALGAWHALWDELAAGSIDDPGLDEARWDLARGYLGSHSAVDLLEELVRLETMGRAPADLDRFGEHLAAITTDDVRAAFRECRAGQVISLVGDEATVAAAVKRGGR